MLRCRITRARTAIRSCRRTTISASAHFSTARRQKSFGYPLEMQVPIRSQLSYGPGANGCARLISSPARACLFLKHRRQHDVRNASPPTILRRRPFAVSRARGGGRLEAGLRLLSITEMVDKPFSLDVSFPRRIYQGIGALMHTTFPSPARGGIWMGQTGEVAATR